MLSVYLIFPSNPKVPRLSGLILTPSSYRGSVNPSLVNWRPDAGWLVRARHKMACSSMVRLKR
jgi:hypothetical protein